MSLAVSAGANGQAVQQTLGHASAATTLDVYAGLLFGDDLDSLTERLDQLASAPRLLSVDHDAERWWWKDLVPTKNRSTSRFGSSLPWSAPASRA